MTALGGNAMVSFFMTHCVLLNNTHKNQVIPTYVLTKQYIGLLHLYSIFHPQGQCLINVGGDVVNVSYDENDCQMSSSSEAN